MSENNKKSILIVEDEQSLQEAMKLKLVQAGVDVLTADTGEEALALIKSHPPTLVSLDILLPSMNGLEVLQKIRNDKLMKNLPVVVVSVSGGPEKIKEAFSFNVLDYLVKSEYTIDNIVKKLKEILGGLE